tara:strand:- start:12703 stop:13695 length:993 start_codon:yes stop_codon:yes gene_type:complete
VVIKYLVIFVGIPNYYVPKQTIMMKKLAFILFASILAISGYAQDAVFKTLAAKGTCMVQRGANPDEYTPISTGVKIFLDDKIIITGTTSYVGLVSSEGKALELKKGGVYYVKDLANALASGETSLAQKYLSLLVNDMSKVDDNTSRNMKYTGSVERSVENKEIVVFLPETTKIAGTEGSIQWFPKNDATSYKVSIVNLYEESIFTEETAQKSISIDFSKLNLKPGQMYKMKVADAAVSENNSGYISLQVPTRSEMAKYETDLNMLRNEVPANSAIGDMVIATYLEDQELFLNAIPYYESAIEKEPNIVEFQDAYNMFLFKIGLESVKVEN